MDKYEKGRDNKMKTLLAVLCMALFVWIKTYWCILVSFIVAWVVFPMIIITIKCIYDDKNSRNHP